MVQYVVNFGGPTLKFMAHHATSGAQQYLYFGGPATNLDSMRARTSELNSAPRKTSSQRWNQWDQNSPWQACGLPARAAVALDGFLVHARSSTLKSSDDDDDESVIDQATEIQLKFDCSLSILVHRAWVIFCALSLRHALHTQSLVTSTTSCINSATVGDQRVKLTYSN